MDIADHALIQENLLLELSLRQKKVVPVHDGVCRNCQGIANENSAFCSGDCRDDYERLQRMKKIKGVCR